MNKKHSEMPICAVANIIPLLLSVSIEFIYFCKILKFLTLSSFCLLLIIGYSVFYLKWRNRAKNCPKLQTHNKFHLKLKSEIKAPTDETLVCLE